MQPLIASRLYPGEPGASEAAIVPEAPMARVAAPRRDPAPSRTAYRLHRLWLTPLFRVLLRKGLPVFALVLGAGLYVQAPERQAAISGWIDGMRQSIAERPEFAVRLMAIDGASAELSDAIRAVVPLDFPLSSFELDLSRIYADVTALDAVASAVVRVRKGGILQIVGTERRPAVVWRSAEAIGTLDGAGHPVTALKARLERPDLPLLVGLGADRAVPEALALLGAAAPIADRIRGLARVGERRWDVVIEPDIRLMLPETDPVPALEQIVALHQANQLLDRDISAVDLRNPARATLRLNGAAAESFRQIKQIPTGVAMP
jgi:cell division protein FtsQ